MNASVSSTPLIWASCSLLATAHFAEDFLASVFLSSSKMVSTQLGWDFLRRPRLRFKPAPPKTGSCLCLTVH
jgi:hypothetical protein